MPRFVLLDFTRPLRCHCGRLAMGAPAAAFLVDREGRMLDLDQHTAFDAHRAAYKMRGACTHEVTFRPDGSAIVCRVAYNAPMGPFNTVMLAEAPAGGDLLGRLFDESQTAAISKDVAVSEAYATAAGELIAAFQNVRQQLINAAAEAGLTNVTFSPEGEVNEDVDSTEDNHGREKPVIEFALTSRNDGEQLILNIRGAAMRTLRDSMQSAYYQFLPLTLTLYGKGPYRERNWQPMAMFDMDESDDDTVCRVEPHYWVNGLRLATVITELARGT
jgi:hypothetical protein